ncbi:type II toxin-antitoxin system PemK/MazF family toxin [Ampullimonas aquatilis]|uniref:type II toxin-antitoxin system PemK/MazF family toxin n=1 Tax=Ampullimonas aquatilis TaxID=1341549 RepID=UPI003C74F927
MAKGKQIEWCPEKAEIIYIQQSSQVGKVMTNRFPILVSSPKAFNACTGIVIGFPMTQDERNQDNPFAVIVQGPNQEMGYVLAFQPKSFYWRDRQLARTLGAATMKLFWPQHLPSLMQFAILARHSLSKTLFVTKISLQSPEFN